MDRDDDNTNNFECAEWYHRVMTSASTKGTLCLSSFFHTTTLLAHYSTTVHCRYKDGELSVGENTCIDRCSSKYWQVTGIVGQMLGAQQGGP